jgi:hypothetical protein
MQVHLRRTNRLEKRPWFHAAPANVVVCVAQLLVWHVCVIDGGGGFSSGCGGAVIHHAYAM